MPQLIPTIISFNLELSPEALKIFQASLKEITKELSHRFGVPIKNLQIKPEGGMSTNGPNRRNQEDNC